MSWERSRAWAACNLPDIISRYSVKFISGHGFKFSFLLFSLVPGQVDALSSRVANYDAIAISWKVPKEPKGNIQVYRVYYNSSDGKSSGNVTTNQLSIKLRNLSPNTTYFIWVLASTSKGYGATSTKVNSTTCKWNETASSDSVSWGFLIPLLSPSGVLMEERKHVKAADQLLWSYQSNESVGLENLQLCK